MCGLVVYRLAVDLQLNKRTILVSNNWLTHNFFHKINKFEA